MPLRVCVGVRVLKRGNFKFYVMAFSIGLLLKKKKSQQLPFIGDLLLCARHHAGDFARCYFYVKTKKILVVCFMQVHPETPSIFSIRVKIQCSTLW